MIKEKMSKKIIIGTVAFLLAIGPFLTSCATILGGGPKKPHERTAEIRWGYFLADIFLTGALGLIIDFATGAIYESKYDKSDRLQKDMIFALEKGVPAYLVKSDGYYRAEIDNGEIKYIKINEAEIPQKVKESLNKEIASKKKELNIN